MARKKKLPKITINKRDTYSEVVTFNCTKDMKEFLLQTAYDNHVSISDVIRHGIELIKIYAVDSVDVSEKKIGENC